jgi:predicted kinase
VAGPYDRGVASQLTQCPCGCGAQLIGMVAEREDGLRQDVAAVAPRSRYPAGDALAAYLISGVPGSGKSTVARLLALHFDRAAHIDIDMVLHHFTVSGLEDPAERTGSAERQADLAVLNAAGLAKNYLDAGYVCVLEGAIAQRHQVLICQQALHPYPLHLVVLNPPPCVSEKRDSERSGKHVAQYFSHLGPLLTDELAGMGVWVDNGEQSPLETVRMVLAHRAEAKL